MRNYIPYAAVFVSVLLLIIFDYDVLYQIQEQNLFLHTSQFFYLQMEQPGGLLTWMGTFLSQFFYYPLVGALLLGLLWWLLVELLKWTFSLAQCMTLTLIPLACLLTTLTNLGYWVYYLQLPGHAFVATLGTLVAVAMVGLFRHLPWRYGIPQALLVATAVIGYPLIGFYSLWSVALMGLFVWADGQREQWTILLAIGIIILVPLCYAHTLYTAFNITDIFTSPLPAYIHEDNCYLIFYVPYGALVLSSMVMVFFCYHQFTHLTHDLMILTLVLLTIFFWFKDGNFYTEMRMVRQLNQQQWEKMLTTAKKNEGEPSRAICLMRNLALYRLGRQPEEALDYPEGTKQLSIPFTPRMVHTVGKQLYLHYGITNGCYRWCMEDGLKNGWTTERLKLMALCCMLHNKPVAARRYLNLLKKTTLCRSWVAYYEPMLYDRPKMYSDGVLGPILPLVRQEDYLSSDHSQLELYLIEQVMNAPAVNRDQEQLTRWISDYYRNNHLDLLEK